MKLWKQQLIIEISGAVQIKLKNVATMDFYLKHAIARSKKKKINKKIEVNIE